MSEKEYDPYDLCEDNIKLGIELGEVKLYRKDTTGTGFDIYINKQGVEVALPTQGYLKEIQERRERATTELSNLPESYQLTHIKDINPDFYKDQAGITRMFMQIQDYISGFAEHKAAGENMYIWSHMCGSGKTMVACAIANELKDRGYRILFTTPSKMLDMMRATFQKESKKSTDDIQKGLKDCDLLVIDDFGTENKSESRWSDSVIYECVNNRYLLKKPILITSNFDIKEVPEDKRIISRLQENCNVIHWPEEGTRSAIGKMNDLKRQERYHQMEMNLKGGIA